MRSHGVVMSSPAFDDDLGLGERIEDFTIQKFVAKPGVEGLNEAILPRTARHDVGGLRAHGSDPLLHRLGDELWPIAPTYKQRRQSVPLNRL